MTAGRRYIYDQNYINQSFNTWYLAGRPSEPAKVRALLPEPPEGLKLPSLSTIERWMVSGAWEARADELDARVHEQTDLELINSKAKMLKEHLEQAKKVTNKALSYLLDDKKGFDSSSAAVNAFFKGLEEQRKTQGFSDLLEKLESMTNNQVRDEIISLINRATENDQIIDTVSSDVRELEENTQDEN